MAGTTYKFKTLPSPVGELKLIASDGSLTGSAGGLEAKATLLKIEKRAVKS